MFTTEDERLEKFRLKSMSTQKTANTAIVLPSVTDYGLDPGFRLESSLLEARQNRQVYTGLADDFSKSALNEELLGNYPESRYMWQQAAAMDRKARQYGEIASGYGATMPTATGTAPQPTVTGTAPQPLPSAEALAEEPGESVPELMDYDSAVSSAQEAYEAYRKAQKEFDREYTWRRDPESASGYDYAYATLQERKQAYLESVDYLLDHHDSFQTAVGLAPRINGTAADREMLQTQLDQMTQEMWDYYNAAPENADPAAIAWYIEEIAAAKAAMASLPEAAVKVAPKFTNRIKQMGESAAFDIVGGYLQSVATITEGLSQHASTDGKVKELNVILEQLIREYNSYIEAGISEEDRLVTQLKEAINNTEAEIEYIQSGQRGEDAAKARHDLYDQADDYYKDGEAARDKAAEGYGTVGEILVDVGIETAKILYDIGIGAITNSTGASSSLVRSFNDGAYDAAKAGWGVEKQIGDGLKAVTIEFLMGKIIEKDGLLDKADDTLIKQIANSIGGNEKLIEQVAKVPVNMMGVYLTTFLFACAETIYNNAITGEHNRNDTKKVTTDAIENFVSSSISYIPLPWLD